MQRGKEKEEEFLKRVQETMIEEEKHRIPIVQGFPWTTDEPQVLLDCGAVQADALTVDRLASLEKYHETAVVPRASILATEVEWLNSIKVDLVVNAFRSMLTKIVQFSGSNLGVRYLKVANNFQIHILWSF